MIASLSRGGPRATGWGCITGIQPQRLLPNNNTAFYLKNQSFFREVRRKYMFFTILRRTVYELFQNGCFSSAILPFYERNLNFLPLFLLYGTFFQCIDFEYALYRADPAARCPYRADTSMLVRPLRSTKSRRRGWYMKGHLRFFASSLPRRRRSFFR